MSEFQDCLLGIQIAYIKGPVTAVAVTPGRLWGAIGCVSGSSMPSFGSLVTGNRKDSEAEFSSAISNPQVDSTLLSCV